MLHSIDAIAETSLMFFHIYDSQNELGGTFYILGMFVISMSYVYVKSLNHVQDILHYATWF